MLDMGRYSRLCALFFLVGSFWKSRWGPFLALAFWMAFFWASDGDFAFTVHVRGL